MNRQQLLTTAILTLAFPALCAFPPQQLSLPHAQVMTITMPSADVIFEISHQWIDYVCEKNNITAPHDPRLLYLHATIPNAFVQEVAEKTFTFNACRNTIKHALEHYCAEISGVTDDAQQSPSKKHTSSPQCVVDIQSQQIFSNLKNVFEPYFNDLANALIKHPNAHWKLVHPAQYTHPHMICMMPCHHDM